MPKATIPQNATLQRLIVEAAGICQDLYHPEVAAAIAQVHVPKWSKMIANTMMLQLQLLRQRQRQSQSQLQLQLEAMLTMVTITMMTITLMQLPQLLQVNQQLPEAFTCNLAVPLSWEFCFSHMSGFHNEHF